jgi:DDE superfamily endonuclease
MAPTTRRTQRITPPPGPTREREADTVKKTWFYSVYDKDHSFKSLRQIAHDEKTPESTARRWLKQRDNIGSLAYRSSRKRSTKLGRQSKVTKSVCKMLVSPSQNPVRDQPYDAQIAFHNIPVQRRQLQRKLKEHTNCGQIYKCAFVKKEISATNKRERVLYRQEHKDKPVEDFWSYIFFTDEAHIDPSAQQAPGMLRERGKRYDDENIVERGEKQGVKFHIAAWITWWDKAEKLEFYKDEEEVEIQPPMPPKPRHRLTTESEEEYQARLREWDALRPHKVDIKPQGNSMTQKYYTERLLPIYINAIQKARLQNPGPWLLQEDRDPSHSIKKKGIAYKLKEENWIVNLKHPAQSPDLNPIEAIWNIIKQRLRHRIFYSDEEIKQALQEEWSKITMTEVRKRITQMPSRCRRLTRNSGGPIKTALW